MAGGLGTILSIPLLFPSFKIQFLSFLLIAFDKIIATFHIPCSRVPEDIYVTLAFLGAWPGLVIGCIICNHKTSRRTKRNFQNRIFLSILGAAMLKGYLLLH
mmetsp:Transcript_21906/g.31441  ORF Transcript_21906/g.31441 Transcript_21906/m.31441 type:complete len:102 (+) Transcript_21906:36-341(+)